MITLINGHVQNQAAMAVPNGSVTFQLNIDASVIAAPYGIIPAEQILIFQFDVNGDILPQTGQAAAQIYSNLELNPQNSEGLGTYYLVTFYDANGARINKSPMWWQFTEAANSTVDIGTMTPFSTVGGNVIFYPTTFTITPPGPSTLGGIFSNAGATSMWVRSINTNGSVSLSQPAFSDISGTLSAAQLPSPLTFVNVQVTGTFQAETTAEIGVVGTTTGQILLDGGTSGQATITAPAIAGTNTNPILFSNSLNIPNGTVYTINTDTGISRGGSAGTIDVGNGTAGNASGTVNAAQYNVAGSQIAASNLSNGTTGTGAIVLAASPTVTGTLTATAITASGLITASLGVTIASGQVLKFSTDTGISRASAAVIDMGNGTAGDASGTVNAAQYNVAGSQIAASNLSNGTTGTGSIVLAASPTITGTLTATAITASGLITANAGETIAAGQVLKFSTDTGISRQSAGIVAIGNGTAGDVTGTIQAGTVQLGVVGTGPTITFGAGAPSGAPVNASFYLRTGGTHAGTSLLYVYDAATTTWVGIA